jgi:hypothetical protein
MTRKRAIRELPLRKGSAAEHRRYAQIRADTWVCPYVYGRGYVNRLRWRGSFRVSLRVQGEETSPLRNGNSGDVGVVRGRKALRPYNYLTGCSVHGSTVLRQAQDRAHHEREDKGHISPRLRGSMKCDLEQDQRKKLR